MRYFSLLDDLFNFTFLLTQEQLDDLPEHIQDTKSSISIISNISSTLLPESEILMRDDRNIELYNYFISACKIDDKIIIDKIQDGIDFIKGATGYDTLLTSSYCASFIIDNDLFKPISNEINVDLIKRGPYHIGSILDVNIFVDPSLGDSYNSILLYNKSKFIVAVYIDSIEVEQDTIGDMILPRLNSKIIAYHTQAAVNILELNKQV